MEAERKESIESERLAKANQFDGLIHEENGTMRFVDSGKEVDGANVHRNLAQVSHKHAASHGHHSHKKPHATHKKQHHVSLAQHKYKTAAKKHADEKYVSKKHAHTLPHHKTVHYTEMELEN